jgi:hypothetical protein
MDEISSARRSTPRVNEAVVKYQQFQWGFDGQAPKIRVTRIAQSRQCAKAWSADEERTIKNIQQTESVPRPEAIRRMQRRKQTSSFSVPRPRSEQESLRAALRLCRNPRCARGDDGGPGSLAHLRADALYCGDTCKKAAQKSLNRENRPSNRQCLRCSKGDKSGSLLLPPTNMDEALKSPAIESCIRQAIK